MLGIGRSEASGAAKPGRRQPSCPTVVKPLTGKTCVGLPRDLMAGQLGRREARRGGSGTEGPAAMEIVDDDGARTWHPKKMLHKPSRESFQSGWERLGGRVRRSG